MLLAQAAPTADPAANKFFIIGDLDAVKAAPANEWLSLLVENLGWIALAYVCGWLAQKALGWASSRFTASPVAQATVSAVGKALPTLLPAYALLFIIRFNAPVLAHADWLHFAALSATFLVSVAHTTAVFHFVAVPMAWARKIADQTENKLDDVLVPMLSTVIRLTVILVGTVKAVSIYDAEIAKSILALLATGGLAIGFASQDTIKNIFGAVMLIIDQPFTLGDHINIGTHEGKVHSLGLRSTTLILVDGQKLAIPNGDLAARAIVNITQRDFIRAQDLIHLESNTPAEKVNEAVEIIRGLLVRHEGHQASHPPHVHVVEFGEWAINVRVMYWYYPANAGQQLQFNQQLILNIAERLQQADIRLAVQGTPQIR